MKNLVFCCVVSVFGFSAACGETDATPDGDVDVDAAIVPAATAYTLGTDFMSSGVLSKIEFPSLEVSSNIVAGVASSDSVLRGSRGYAGNLYIVNRQGSDNITVVNPATAQLVDQVSTGAGSNPQDIAISGNPLAGEVLYVCSFNTGEILVLEPGVAEPIARIDISSYDPDGIPNCTSIAAVNGRVFAFLSLLDDSWAPQGPGRVVVIDSGSNTIEDDFELVNSNPFGFVAATTAGSAFEGDLLVGTTDFGTGGCIERVSTTQTPESKGCLITNDELGGYVSVMQAVDDVVWAAVSTSTTSGKLVRVSSDGNLDDDSLTPAEQLVTDFVVCPSGDFVTNDGNTGSIKIYDADGVAVSATPFDIGLPPAYTGGMVCQ